MTTKWASCSTDGNLNFNSEILDIDKELGKYVIVHELLHFKIPNHGKLWKSLMSVYIENWVEMDKKLKMINTASARPCAPAEEGGGIKK
jgi:predicted metal-dependent hydrolase